MTRKENQRERKGHLYRTLQAISIAPVLILGIVIIVFASQTFTGAMHKEVKSELKNISSTVAAIYDILYPGDYRLVGENAYDLVKGDTVLTGDYSIIDRIKKDTGMEITLFYHDTRILTTIRDENGSRIIGTSAESRVLNTVLKQGEAHFYTNATVNGILYFAYYAPLYNSDGSIAGMVYAGKPCSRVNAAIVQALAPLVILTALSVLLAGIISSSYTRKLIYALQQIKGFLSRVSTGNLSAEMDSSILRRHDELSEMARSASHMQTSLRRLVEEDTLTGLHNRRFGDKKLRQIQENASRTQAPFTVAIGDIDFFKRVNDTYGHECGDTVLQQVAEVLKRNMLGHGTAARWGGEEFLLIFNHMELAEAEAYLQKVMEEIRNISVRYEEQEVRITMTFGLAQGTAGGNIKQLLREADEKLYAGKANGRNCILA